MHDLTRAALGYLAQGCHLLALTGKRPNPKYHDTWDWENSIHGLPENEAEEAALDAVFSDHTTTGVAILIGEHQLVADIDTEAAAELWMSLAGGVPTGRVAKTPNGIHVWFWVPGANASVWLGKRTLLFKGFGGYVAAPPSRHFNEDGVEDGVYTWLTEQYDALPEGVERAIRMVHAVDAVESPFANVPAPRDLHPEMVDGSWTGRGWASTDITGLCDAIEHAADGNQNNMIHWAACTARDEGVPLAIAMPQLLAAAIRGNHPERRARATILSAYRNRARQ